MTKNEQQNVMLNEVTVFNLESSKRESYIRNELAKLKSGSKLIGIGDRGYTFIVTKIDYDNYECLFGKYKDIVSTKSIINNILREKVSFYNFPNSINIEYKNVIEDDDDEVVVYKNNEKIYLGEEQNEPMKNESWRFCKDYGIYWYIGYPSINFYLKQKLNS